jgi:hypothetical protein
VTRGIYRDILMVLRRISGMKSLSLMFLFALLCTGTALAAVPVHSVARTEQTLAVWREHVGHGSLTARQTIALTRDAHTAVGPTRAAVLKATVTGGMNGPAVYLDLVSRTPVWTLRHAHALIRSVTNRPFTGGWAIRLRNADRVTVWIAGYAGNEGFVGSATPAIDAVSPVAHG